MLAIARGLMARPRVLLLDEPSLGLSPLLVKEIKAIILDIGERFGASVLLVEQNAGLALAVASRGYLMQNGRIVVSGPIAELQRHVADARTLSRRRGRMSLSREQPCRANPRSGHSSWSNGCAWRAAPR